ncbi:hypothetical protein DENSPDRAFT_271797 [Dentipellis sp. KUC8613]|nr:hypothetical protein DENSPDRAFT_271797 [Dentipellis sp. KUC8613]
MRSSVRRRTFSGFLEDSFHSLRVDHRLQPSWNSCLLLILCFGARLGSATCLGAKKLAEVMGDGGDGKSDKMHTLDLIKFHPWHGAPLSNLPDGAPRLI